MWKHRLNAIGGEFVSVEREAAFQAERFSETLRHARLVFLCGVFLNTLFLLSDWRFAGQTHFWVAVPARVCVILISLVCLLASRNITRFGRLQALMVTWEIIVAGCVAALCSSRSDIALFVMLLLPAIYMIVVPTRFLWSVTTSAIASVALTAGYLLPGPLPSTAFGICLAVLVSNVAMLLFVVRSNRLRRLEWTATQAERRANTELAESRRLFETMFKAVPIPIVVSRADDGQIVDANDAASRFYGLDDGEALTRYNTRDLVDGPTRRVIQAELDRNGTANEIEITTGAAGRVRRDALLSAVTVEMDGATRVISSLVDMTSRKAVEERIRLAAQRDVLTGLPNRALFQTTLDAALSKAEASGQRVGLILIDLDAFKEVNDTLGHDAGDALLKEVARRLGNTIGEHDLVARLGGDEFVVIALCEKDRHQSSRRIHALSRAILDVLKPAMAVSGRAVSPRASLGLALFPEHATNPTDLFTNADLALYAAKAAGRNRATLFVPALRADIEHRVSVAREMRLTLEVGGLIPYYQPKISLATGRIVGFEALARWQHPTRGLLSPASFSTVFDDAEIGIAVGHVLARQIFADMAGWIAQGYEPGRMFLNLSSAQFAQENLAESLIADLSAAGLAHDRIGVEVTETVLLGGHGDRVSAVLATLHRAGIRVALDDFGTGYASLTHLKQYPVDEIKVDRSFVRDLERDANDAAIVTAVVQLGQSLGLDVTAEGVETEAQAAFLREQGCVYAQGYLYSKPMPQSRVPWFLNKHGGRAASLGAATSTELRFA
ncbi:EAL domain-containing protein [Methylobacterium sp. W2]|uniref:putative bifunctional diguanylate cyclase/phosphodiesterase n=1 Tax=Methylobacterium sp. W2 TaxID=2598107 RepID=UPI001D0C087B|nr:EAL domain-containing protein [Methylobacterium sp. W2]MCC0807572.1 EAL domain-containing protein [Methylobacterium sp. W2]